MWVGLLGLLAGYTLAFYGFDQITGGNDGLWSIFWPGQYKVVARDSGAK